ncbi:hypothetical protein, partial [Mesomycoplasma hyorhinis]|uniref:hypothetical protein n=1 Tax=Mesomycoplasma hyorhinis TaxID=2100 RepID=UPI001C03EAA4
PASTGKPGSAALERRRNVTRPEIPETGLSCWREGAGRREYEKARGPGDVDKRQFQIIVKNIKFVNFFHISKKKKKKKDWDNFSVKLCKDFYKWQQYTQIIITSFIY